jgi:hypothetical protein
MNRCTNFVAPAFWEQGTPVMTHITDVTLPGHCGSAKFKVGWSSSGEGCQTLRRPEQNGVATHSLSAPRQTEGAVIPTWWKDVDTIIVGLIVLILIAVFFGTDRKQKKLRRG